MYARIGHDNNNLCCGVFFLKHYRHTKQDFVDEVEVGPDMFKDWLKKDYTGFNKNLGAGFIKGGFTVESERDEETFNIMSEHFQLVFKTEPRRNANSNHMFYFAMWDFTKNANGEPI